MPLRDTAPSLHMPLFLEETFFTVYKSVKDQQGIESSVQHYVPKRAFHMVWIYSHCCLVLWQARHRSLVYIQYKLQNTRVKLYKECTEMCMGAAAWDDLAEVCLARY